jgi:PhzF family phenazine biosynthesis protein
VEAGTVIVDACLRDGRGGSPTLVLEDTPMSDAERALLPSMAGTSHAALVTLGDGVAEVRFFTPAGELPACGHGTVAALMWLADRVGRDGSFTLRISGRTLSGRVSRSSPRGPGRAWFDQAPVSLRDPVDASPVLDALGLDREPAGMRAASTGRWRLLIPVDSRAALEALDPDFGALRSACDAAGLLGCYVYAPLEPGGRTALRTALEPGWRTAARMFAPSIGVPEDIANANSTSCLVAALSVPEISVDMGDRLGHPATVHARLDRGRLQAGGAARLRP